MQRKTKIWLVTAGLLVVVGLGLFAAVAWKQGWDFTKLSTGEYETNTYEISEDFDCLALYIDTADIVFLLSQDGKCKVECFEDVKAKHVATVEEDTLRIQVIDERTLLDRIGIIYESPKITVYLPQNQYNALLVQGSTGNVTVPQAFSFDTVSIAVDTGTVSFCASASGQVKVKTSTGAIRVENSFAEILDLSVSTGMVTVSKVTCLGNMNVRVSTGKAVLTEVTCKNLISNGSTGDITLDQVIAAEAFTIERSTGDVIFKNSDALSISVITDTGDVTGSLLTGKDFKVETDTGSISVPKEVTGGLCQITTDTGNIKITIP